MPTGKQRYLLIVGLGCALVPALALSELPHDRIPSAEPGIDFGTTASVGENVDAVTLTAAIPLLPNPDLSDAPDEVLDVGVLKTGLDALGGSDVDEARKFRDSLPADALDRHILTWAIAMSGEPAVSSGEIAAAAQILSKWPGAESLRNNRERALYRENPDPQSVIDSFRRQRTADRSRRERAGARLSGARPARRRTRRVVAVLAHAKARGARRGGDHQANSARYCRAPTTASAWSACCMRNARSRRSASQGWPAPNSSPRRGRPCSAATRTPASCWMPCLPRSVRQATCSPRRSICAAPRNSRRQPPS